MYKLHFVHLQTNSLVNIFQWVAVHKCANKRKFCTFHRSTILMFNERPVTMMKIYNVYRLAGVRRCRCNEFYFSLMLVAHGAVVVFVVVVVVVVVVRKEDYRQR